MSDKSEKTICLRTAKNTTAVDGGLATGKSAFYEIYTSCAKPNLSIIKAAAYLAIAFFIITSLGCSLDGGPRARVGYLPTATFGVRFPDPNRLGTHSYGFGFSEVGGIVYTCRAGHIDIDHLRGNADTTRYLVKKIRNVLSKNAKGFSFNLTGELSSHKIRLTYPQNWDTEPEKENIIEEIAFSTAPYLAYNATIWHEILTWFGVHFALIEPEFNSAFSWEDVYSNLVGTRLGIEALNNTEYDFDKAMTLAIQRQLKELQVQPRSTAIHASDKVRNQWYTGNFIPNNKMRNFDIGLDGFVTPTRVPNIPGCNSQPLPLPVPTLDILKQHGFSISYEIKPNVLEQGRIFKAAASKKIVPEKHFPIILQHMKQEAVKKGYNYDE